MASTMPPLLKESAPLDHTQECGPEDAPPNTGITHDIITSLPPVSVPLYL